MVTRETITNGRPTGSKIKIAGQTTSTIDEFQFPRFDDIKTWLNSKAQKTK